MTNTEVIIKEIIILMSSVYSMASKTCLDIKILTLSQEFTFYLDSEFIWRTLKKLYTIFIQGFKLSVIQAGGDQIPGVFADF